MHKHIFVPVDIVYSRIFDGGYVRDSSALTVISACVCGAVKRVDAIDKAIKELK